MLLVVGMKERVLAFHNQVQRSLDTLHMVCRSFTVHRYWHRKTGLHQHGGNLVCMVRGTKFIRLIQLCLIQHCVHVGGVFSLRCGSDLLN